MLNLYQTVIHNHDHRFVALAVGVCALGSLTSVVVAQHAVKRDSKAVRLNWLLFAGLITGLSIWTTQFTAMLGYRTDLDIRFDIAGASASMLVSVLSAMAAWVFGYFGRTRGVLAGAIIGVSIAAAHIVDVMAIRIPGSIVIDHTIRLAAICTGLSLAAASGYLFVRWKDGKLAWPAALALFAAMTVLHFAAISGVTLLPAPAIPGNPPLTESAVELATVVVSAYLLLLAAALSLTWQSIRTARATAEEQGRLIEALENLRKTEDHHLAYVELNPQIAWVADPSGNVTEIPPLWEKLVGVPREKGIGDGWKCVVHPDDLPEILEMWDEAIRTGDDRRVDARYRIRLVDGTYRWFRVRARPRRDDDGAVLAWYGSLEDIHDQVIAETALRESEERYRLASRATNDVIWDWSVEDGSATWAGAHKKVLGYPELQSPTKLSWWHERIHADDLPQVLASQARALASDATYWSEEYRFRIASGDWIDVKSRCVIVRSKDGSPTRVVGSMLDITQQKRAEADLNWTAYHDPLTRLPNRGLYQNRIRSAIDAAKRSDLFVALVVIDLNGFKELNDTLGHAAGDSVLEETARRLVSSVPHDATVARLGGDEFAVILPGLAASDAYKDHVRTFCQSLIEPVTFHDLRIPISYGAGVAIWPRDANDPGELLIAADLALYASKTEMPGTVEEFSPLLKAASERRSGMLARARAGLTEGRIVPFYQPKVDLHTGRIMGWEALLRIRDGDRMMSPADIEAAFADADITVQLTDQMFSRVFADLATWRRQDVAVGRIAVNVSAGDFRQHRLAERLQTYAERHGQTLSDIDIEVTEGVLIGQLGPEVSRMLEKLRSLGVMVALDDFGTGYASLTHLQEFPVDVIKIDRSFIERIDETDQKATAVIDAVLQMAKRLGMQTVAEGIETKLQARYLRARGCTIGQGYLFSRPVPAADVKALLTSQSYGQWEFDTTRAS